MFLYSDVVNEFKITGMCFLFRWEVIANFINSHSTSGIKRTAKDVIHKAKNLQKLGRY